MNFDKMLNANEKDSEKEQITKKIEKYFTESIEGLEEAGFRTEEDKKTITNMMNIVDDMKNNDYSPAYNYFEKEINRLEKRIVEVSGSEVGKESTVPICKKAIKELEELRDRLMLSEKE